MQKSVPFVGSVLRKIFLAFCICSVLTGKLFAQGVTTGSIRGFVTNENGEPLVGANVLAFHEPSGTQYGTSVRAGGFFHLRTMKIGGPYTITVSRIGYKVQIHKNGFVNLGRTTRIDFTLSPEIVRVDVIQVVAEESHVLSTDKTGAATSISVDEVNQLPSVKRSARDLFRLDPRNDGNFSFGGQNWLFNNISIDGSYFNNSYGLDDPIPGGQTNSEPVSFAAIEQAQVSVAPFDVRQSGFTGANLNLVTKSGGNQFRGAIYSYGRNEDLTGGKVSGEDVLNPDLSFHQTGFTFSGPIVHNKFFFFLNGEIERRDDPGTNFTASRPGLRGPSVSRVEFAVMDSIRQRMIKAYNYDPGTFEDFVHETNNEKLFLKFDWNLDANNHLTFRYNRLDARRDLPPQPFAISLNNKGRGPSEDSLPFKNSGYEANNESNSYALEINSRFGLGGKYINRFFLSYNRFRDFRDPFSSPFPTLEIGQNGRTYTTVGHEPFSINNILDQDVWQVTNHFNILKEKHVITLGANFERFSFFNSFNLFYHGLFFLPVQFGGTRFDSLDDFFAYTNPELDPCTDALLASGEPCFRNFNTEVQQQLLKPFNGDDIDLAQLSIYAQDEYLVTENLNLTYGLRIDLPIYFTDIPDNTFSESLTLLNKSGNLEIINASHLPAVKLLPSPRIGFSWDVFGDHSTQLRGGSGIFTGRLPFAWIGNTVSNQGPNASSPSFDVTAIDPDFKWPQVWKTNIALDKKLPWGVLGTFEILYENDINAIFVRNADLPLRVRVLPTDGRPYFGGASANKLNPNFAGRVYVLDNTSDGHMINVTAQIRKNFDFGLNAGLSYSFLDARKPLNSFRDPKNQFSPTEMVRSLWRFNPVQGNPNKPETSFSEFGNRHRIIGSATYSKRWSRMHATHVGLFLQIAQGAPSTALTRSRFSYTYNGDVNGDGADRNDLIYIPRDASEITFADILDENNNVISTAQQQWSAFNAFIEQDSYLRSHRGEIADRNAGITPWFSDIDLRVLQDISFDAGGQKHMFQLSLDILNLGNLMSSSWGVKKFATPNAQSPLEFTNQFTPEGDPIFQFPGITTDIFLDDSGLSSRWRVQLGIRYLFN
ncbi:MAG: carboxypeptidase regulatory-like domain-containing protein [bacterium]